MLTPQTRLRPNEKEVAAKVIDGEAIMINLSNGMYYSMDKVGALIWELITARRSLVEMAATIAAQYDVSAQQAQADLEPLAAQLVQENLVQTAEDEGSPLERPVAAGDGRLPYDLPKLEIYRDIGHLFALDPPMPGLQDVPWTASDESPPQPRV